MSEGRLGGSLYGKRLVCRAGQQAVTSYAAWRLAKGASKWK